MIIMQYKNGIIVDGAEHRGKSSFCKSLSTLTGLKCIHMTKEYGFHNGSFDYIEGYFTDIDNSNKGFIFDRFYTSELVYGKLRGKINITEEKQQIIENKLRALNYLFVLLDTENIPWDYNRKHTISYDDNKEIKKLFFKLYDICYIPKMIIDPTHEDSLSKVYEAWKKLNK